MAEKIQIDIKKIKEILEYYDEKKILVDYEAEMVELESKRVFMQNQLNEHENMYLEYKESDKLYYEPNTYEYFKKLFSGEPGDKKSAFINEVLSFVTDDIKPSQKVKVLEELVKAYKEIEDMV